MLELKKVSKIYKSKNQEIRALDEVNLYFEERGMVFVTGKSGSGKTTLLNVIGGLDNFDGGEILIKGKSTDDFTKTDYDSYRNTYVGFVFQEYNLLDNMTIEQNLSLALKLQGKKCDKQSVDEILDKVDLQNVAQRRPQELSGGQRQRVAIARALIKNPAIIMADEPTGALDTENGRQVISLLKDLSKDKLVIVVSHDIELADSFADRIIHMKDGQIESDYTVETAKQNADNIYETEQGLSIRRKAKLKEDELKKIKTAVESGKNIEITDKISARKVPTVINDKTVYDGTEGFIKTKLRFKDTVALGLSALKTKRIRLAITIILCVFAFTIFGLFDSLAVYDEGRMAENAIKYSISPSVVITAEMKENDSSPYTFNAGDALLKQIANTTGYDVKGVYNSYYVGSGTPLELLNSSRLQYYGFKSLRGVVEFSREDLSNYGFSMMYGRLPESYDEIALPYFYAKCMINSSYNYDNGTVLVNEVEEFADENNPLYITIGTVSQTKSYKIVGIVDVGAIDKKFDFLKETAPDGTDMFNSAPQADQLEYKNYINSGYNLIGFVKTGFVTNALRDSNTLTQYVNGAYSFPLKAEGETNANASLGNNRYYRYADLRTLTSNFSFIDREQTLLREDEFLVDVSQLPILFKTEIDALLSVAEDDSTYGNEAENIKVYLSTIVDSRASTADKMTALRNAIDGLNSLQKVMHEAIPSVSRTECIYAKTFTASKLDTNKNQAGTTIPIEAELENKTYKIAGFYVDVGLPNTNVKSVIVTDEALDNFGITRLQGNYSSVIATNTGKGQMRSLSKLFFKDKGVIYQCSNTAISLVKTNSAQFERLSNLFWIASGVFAAFSIVMFSNFISTSIKNKYGEIGILRALGARGRDIMKMFIAESAVIAIINALGACILAWIGTLLVNSYIKTYFNFYIPIANFGLRQILITLALSVLVAIVSAVIPITLVSKQKPVETIRKSY